MAELRTASLDGLHIIWFRVFNPSVRLGIEHNWIILEYLFLVVFILETYLFFFSHDTLLVI